ncbi:hypothetical protein ACFLVI_00410 [Chloroflexota bacterium]
MRILEIGIDIDGVIADLVTAILPVLSETRGSPVCYDDICDLDIGKVLQIENKMYAIWSDVYTSGILRSLLPIKGAITGLGEFGKHRIHIVTHRIKASKEDTEWWLNDKNIKYCTLEFVPDAPKHSTGIEFDVFIEDSLEQACAMAEAGIKTILLDQPWNQSLSLPQRCNRLRDWGCITESIKLLEQLSFNR